MMSGEPATRKCWEDTEKLFQLYLTLAAIEEMEERANSRRVKETAMAARISRTKRARGSVADAQESL